MRDDRSASERRESSLRTEITRLQDALSTAGRETIARDSVEEARFAEEEAARLRAQLIAKDEAPIPETSEHVFILFLVTTSLRRPFPGIMAVDL